MGLDWTLNDCARFVAALRSRELSSSRPLIRDVWASKLAGDLGQMLVDRFPTAPDLSAGPAVRAHLIDEVVNSQLAEGVKTFVAVGAGYDMRPYRIQLPADVTWIEIDSADVVKPKEEILDGVEPDCSVQRHVVDFEDLESQQELLNDIGVRHDRVSLLTEGLLVYLTEEHVAQLAANIRNMDCEKTWTTDLASPSLVELMNQAAQSDPNLSGIRWHFGPENPNQWYSDRGWRITTRQSCIAYADSIDRPLMTDEMKQLMINRRIDPDLSSTIITLE